MRTKIQSIIEFCEENSIEIVSYGLAPNPNGFCFELFHDSCSDEANALDEMLNSLNSKEVTELRNILFGVRK